MVASTLEMSQSTEQVYLPLRKVLAVGIGNALEFYDFITFSFFSIQIAHSFFPTSQTTHGLLFSLATFGAGFLTRPLGGIVIGRYADRAGRKAAMMLSFALMGAGIVGLALTPSYAQIGLSAPVLLLVFRLIQGFALGGEVGPSTAFLMEVAPPNRRGLYVSVQSGTQAVATLASGFVGMLISSSLAPAVLDQWGWRIAFLLGAAVVPFGLYLRRSLPETLHTAADVAGPKAPRRVPIRLIVLSLMILASLTIATYGRAYLTTYAQDTLKLATSIAFGASVINGLCGVLTAPLAGLMSDRFGRRPVMILATCINIALIVPAFMAMNRAPGLWTFYITTTVLGSIGWIAGTPVLTAISESLPMSVRSGALATLYAVAIATFGGTTQFTIKWLIDATGNPLAPAWYMTGALIIGGAAMLGMRESAPVKGGS